jgi:hypothetical protein
MKNLETMLILLCAAFAVFSVSAQQSSDGSRQVDIRSQLAGAWVINDELSDNSDDQVEVAIKESGGKVPRRWFRKRAEDFYRGGPVEQELYDRITYDDVLNIEYIAPEFRFRYADDYQRIFHTDGRRRSSTANSFYSEGGADFSFGNWDAESLVVEARPRDGGFTLETYTLEEDGRRLRVVVVLAPASFRTVINLVRVYDRVD